MKFGMFSVADHYPKELPRSLDQFYGELLDQIVAAEDLGYESFWVAEHHFHEYGVIPSSSVWMSAAAQRTKRIRLGTAVSVLSLGHPLRTAEEYAMVDLFSQGRLNLGVGSGYLKHEFDGFNIPIEEKRQRFDEALDIMRLAWNGKRFSYQGDFTQVNEVQLNVKPYQDEVPIWIAVLRNEAAPFVGRKKMPMMMIPYATTEVFSEMADTVTAFKEGYAEAGGDTATVQLPFGLHTYCAPTKEQAVAEGGEAMDRYVRTRLYAKSRPLDLLMDKDLVAFGEPEQIIRVAKRYESIGLTHFLAMSNFGGMPHQKVIDSMALMAREVFPAFETQSIAEIVN